MARKFAQIQLAIWDDEDFLDLSMPAQWLYLHLSTSAELSFAGVADWRPKRIKPKAAALSTDVIESAAQELADALFIIIDEDTEEVLVRSFIRHDELLRQKNMGVAVARAYSLIASRQLRGVVVHELHRLRADNPSWPSWEGLADTLTKRSVSPSGNPSTKGSPSPSASPAGMAPFGLSASPSPNPSTKGSAKGS